ncbi:hypothetical protein WA026_023659 [Henosepilachna vigintioctopunctata]|uniref:Uncharacterized protein n=1 Tax=Henosepilachna vigintioctopunctata TaxID=420089 RepID=A0AAW1V6Y3_9CUCU
MLGTLFAIFAANLLKSEPKILFSIKVPHRETFPVPFRPQLKAQEQPLLSQACSDSESSEFLIASTSVELHLINSEEFNDFVGDSDISKE